MILNHKKRCLVLVLIMVGTNKRKRILKNPRVILGIRRIPSARVSFVS